MFESILWQAADDDVEIVESLIAMGRRTTK